MNAIVTHNIFRLKAIWKRIVSENVSIRPTQHYDYYRYLWLVFCVRHIGQRWRVEFHLMEEGANRCIIPLIVNHKRKKIRGFAYYGRLDYEDIISSTTDHEFNKACLTHVFGRYKGYSVYIDKINENSTLFSLIESHMHFDINCVCIDTRRDYEQWLSGISKHQQQNIRSAYNRADREAFVTQIKVFDELHPIPRKLWRKCCYLYERRGGDKGNRWQLWYRRQLNAFTHILHRVEGHRIYVLKHGETPVAYMAGMFSKRHRCFYVPRLSHDIDYNRYSPGILLVCETIKALTAEGVQYLDLMYGDEPYKLAMGGTINKNYRLDCMVDDLL